MSPLTRQPLFGPGKESHLVFLIVVFLRAIRTPMILGTTQETNLFSFGVVCFCWRRSSQLLWYRTVAWLGGLAFTACASNCLITLLLSVVVQERVLPTFCEATFLGISFPTRIWPCRGIPRRTFSTHRVQVGASPVAGVDRAHLRQNDSSKSRPSVPSGLVVAYSACRTA